MNQAPGNSFLGYLALLQRYALLILLTILLGIGIAAWTLQTVVEPVYQASTSLLVLEQRAGGISGLVSQLETELESLGPLRNLALQGMGNQSSTADLLSILRSRSLAEKVAVKLPLKQLPEVQRLLEAAPAGSEQRLLVEYLQKHSKILPPDSQDGTLRIRIRLPEPSLCAMAANAYVRELQVYVGSLINRDQARQLDYLEAQLAKLEGELGSAERELLRFQQRHQTVALDEEIKQLIGQLGELEASELNARAALQDARARSRELDQSANELDPGSPRARTDLDLELAGLQERQRTLNQARARYQSMLSGLPVQALSLARLQRQVTLKSQLYLLLQQQTQAARLDAARSVELFRVLDPAQAPLAPIYPVKGLWLAVAAVVSLALGVVMATLLDLLGRVTRLNRARTKNESPVPEPESGPETVPDPEPALPSLSVPPVSLPSVQPPPLSEPEPDPTFSAPGQPGK